MNTNNARYTCAQNQIRSFTMNHIRKAIVLVSLGLVLTGCSINQTPQQQIEAETALPCYFPDTREEAPGWVCTGHIGDQLVSGVGQFPPSQASYNLRFQTAEQRARVNLSRKLEMQLTSALKDYEENTGAGMNETVDRVIENLSSSRQKVTLVGSRVYSSITGPDGSLFVLVGIDKALASQNLQRLVRSSFDNPEASWQRNLAKDALSELEDVAARSVEGG